MSKFIVGARVAYSSYGTSRQATVTRISADGRILFLDNGRWIHEESAKRVLPEYLFASETDGALYDTRVQDWSRKPALRPIYKRSFRDIFTIAELKATLRNGAYAFPGGYPLYFVAGDGEALSFESVLGNWREVVAAFQPHGDRAWRAHACQINYEDMDLTCAQSGKRIPSAYGEDEGGKQ